MLENPLKILIKKQLCSSNVQPPFSKILDNQLKYIKTKQRLRSTNLHPPFFQNKGFL